MFALRAAKTSVFEIVFTACHHTFEEEWTCGNHRSDQAMKQCCQGPMPADAKEKKTDIDGEEAPVDGAKLRHHLWFTCKILHWHGVEHQDEE